VPGVPSCHVATPSTFTTASSRVGFALEDLGNGRTWVRFHHTGWPDAGEHYRTSSHCWALYLRILRRFVEHGETVPYADRLSV
jgi:hypothetical protein